MWSAAAFILVGLATGYGAYVYRKHQAAAFFRRREPLTEEEIFSRFYGGTNFRKEEVLELWKEVAEVFHLPFGVLRPTDRFGQELRGYWLIDNEVDEISDRAHSRLKRKKKAIDLHEISSLDEYIRTIVSEVKEVKDTHPLANG